MPDTSEPANKPAAQANSIPQPVELTDGEYHEVADVFLENALSKFEEIQDQSDEVDVEFSVGFPAPFLETELTAISQAL